MRGSPETRFLAETGFLKSPWRRLPGDLSGPEDFLGDCGLIAGGFEGARNEELTTNFSISFPTSHTSSGLI